ncbi:hypothetical protein CVS40_4912 [Lucilia cuprina]|nr:hypothetical protein CVS40_4912 [Lucilia cuprina]
MITLVTPLVVSQAYFGFGLMAFTHAVPIYEGFAMAHSIYCMFTLLNGHSIRREGFISVQQLEFEIVTFYQSRKLSSCFRALKYCSTSDLLGMAMKNPIWISGKKCSIRNNCIIGWFFLHSLKASGDRLDLMAGFSEQLTTASADLEI